MSDQKATIRQEPIRLKIKCCVYLQLKAPLAVLLKHGTLAIMAQSQIQIKLKMISSPKRFQQRECVRSCVCFPEGQARGNQGLSLMYEKILLYGGKSQLAVDF